MGLRVLPILLISIVCVGCVSNKGKPLANASIDSKIGHAGIHNEFLKDSVFKNETSIGTDNKGAIFSDNVVINVVKENPITWILKNSVEFYKYWQTNKHKGKK